MKTKPVRVCDVSRILRISSASLISFLEEKGYSVIGEFRSPLSSTMVELIQNGYNEGPPFQELNPFMPQAEEWEKLNEDTLKRLHTPPPKPARSEAAEEGVTIRKTRTRKPKLKIISHRSTVYTGRIDLIPIDLELIHQILELDESNKIKVRDFLRRKTILKALSQLD
jgi:hypothetical protein